MSGFAVVPPREGYKPEPDASALPLDKVRTDKSEIPVADRTLVLDSSEFVRI